MKTTSTKIFTYAEVVRAEGALRHTSGQFFMVGDDDEGGYRLEANTNQYQDCMRVIRKALKPTAHEAHYAAAMANSARLMK
ncbi:MAG: hypothetical protein LCH38_05330 [Proteobacteria bacterium]|nr:hypothetical protein [Pseudomonadota bacterium]